MTPPQEEGEGAPPTSSSSSPTSAGGVGESVIRYMTRLSLEHGAINLSQGFPNEPPPLPVRVALARAVLSGVAEPASADELNLLDAGEGGGDDGSEVEAMIRKIILAPGVSAANGTYDELNQYSPPMGRPDLRAAIAKHYKTMYGYEVDPDQCITVTLGATEAVASALRTVGRPGDRAVIFEPYHELYPSQCRIFYLEPSYVTLREDASLGKWTFDESELEEALSGAKVLMLNDPHNPTGKVFTMEELRVITDLCAKHDVYIITDEIYEHMTYGPQRGKHVLLPGAFPNVADRTLVCNSVGKSASATGWRVGWCLMPPHLTSVYRGVHDQLVVMAPHPMQYATLTYLNLPLTYFRETLATRYVERLDMLTQSLWRVGFEVSKPEGAYYLFARYRNVEKLRQFKPWDAVTFMVKEVGVACVPGNNFYGSTRALKEEGDEYLRFAACRSTEDITLACEKIENALGQQSSP